MKKKEVNIFISPIDGKISEEMHKNENEGWAHKTL